MAKLTFKEHKQRHVELHKALDQLVADFIDQTGKFPSDMTVIELIEWSHNQTKNPTERGGMNGK